MAVMNVRLLEQMAAMGNAEAQCALGTSFLMGEGVPQNAERAAALFEKAAEQGDARAECNLGAMYAQGLGVQQDYGEARKWYAKSAAKDNPDGQYNLSIIYAQGIGGCKKDLKKARELCRKAADQGQDKAKAMLPSLMEQTSTKATSNGDALNDRKTKACPEMQGEQNKPVNGPNTALGKHESDSRKLRDSSQTQDTERDSCIDVCSKTERPSEVSAATDTSATRKEVCFGTVKSVELAGPDGKQPWKGTEAEARFPKPGSSGHRKLSVLRSLASEDEVAAILRIAQTSLEFNVDNDSVDRRPTYERYVVQIGQYVHAELEPILRPIIEDRILPYVRQKYNAPEAMVCTVLVRRYLPDERRIHPTHLDGHSFCTAVLGLNVEEFDGGLYVQPQPDTRTREFVKLGRGDLAVHQYDLPHGVRVYSGRRYSIIFWIKDCIQSCVTNETPWYEAAANAGDPDAMTALAQKLNKGMNAEKVGGDPVAAVRWFKTAAEMGHIEAQTHLGVLYESGTVGLPPNGKEAVSWWKKAAEAGDSTSQRLLALAYSHGSCGVLRDDAEAVRWMTRAADQEDWDAMYWLSMCHYRGLGVPVDPAKGMEWTVKAADMGHPEAQCALASACLTGDGQPKDFDSASLWFRRAALNGNASAQCNLGAFYAQGLGNLQPDLQEALFWYRASAERGNPDGQHNLALMYSQGLGGLPIDMNQARAWCMKAAEQGQLKAIAMLASLPTEEDTGVYTSKDENDGNHIHGENEQENGLNICSMASEDTIPERANEDALGKKVTEARNLLAEIREQNASTARACGLLDNLLRQLNDYPATGCIGSQEAKISKASTHNSTFEKGHTAPSGRNVKVVNVWNGTELSQNCRECSEPFLVRGGTNAIDFMSQVCEAAGKQSVSWEVQADDKTSTRSVDGNFQGCWETIGEGMSARSILMQDGKILNAFVDDVPAPPYLASNSFAHMLPIELSPVSGQWLTLGSQDARSQLHRERHWLVWHRVLQGTVDWRLLPPDTPDMQGVSLGQCGIETSPTDAFRGREAWEVQQIPGDVLVVPHGWWQQFSHSSNRTAVASALHLTEMGVPSLLNTLQTASALPEVELTGHPCADIRLIAGLLVGQTVERPDRRGSTFTTQAMPATLAVVQPLSPLDGIEFID